MRNYEVTIAAVLQLLGIIETLFVLQSTTPFHTQLQNASNSLNKAARLWANDIFVRTETIDKKKYRGRVEENIDRISLCIETSISLLQDKSYISHSFEPERNILYTILKVLKDYSTNSTGIISEIKINHKDPQTYLMIVFGDILSEGVL